MEAIKPQFECVFGWLIDSNISHIVQDYSIRHRGNI